MFAQLTPEQIISVHNVSEIYKVPLLLREQNVAEIISNSLHMYLPKGMPDIRDWELLCNKLDKLDTKVNIAIVGKYNSGTDAYLSITKALQHAAVSVNRKLEMTWVNAEMLEDCATAEEKAEAMAILQVRQPKLFCELMHAFTDIIAKMGAYFPLICAQVDASVHCKENANALRRLCRLRIRK